MTEKYGEPWASVTISRLERDDWPQRFTECEARIVACVNACAGLDLPDDVPVGALAELVAACRGIDGVQKEGEIWSVNPSEFKAFKSAVRAALAALEAL